MELPLSLGLWMKTFIFWKNYKIQWHKTSKLLFVVGLCLVALKFNDIAREVTASLHEQHKNETPEMKNQKKTFVITNFTLG